MRNYFKKEKENDDGGDESLKILQTAVQACLVLSTKGFV